MKFSSILEGIESSYHSDQNITLELVDFEYQLKAEDISRYLMSSSNRSLILKTKEKEKIPVNSFFSLGEEATQGSQKLFSMGNFSLWIS